MAVAIPEAKNVSKYYPGVKALTAIAAVSGGLIPLKSIVSHEYAFKDLIDGVAHNVDNKQDAIKAVVKF